MIGSVRAIIKKEIECDFIVANVPDMPPEPSRVLQLHAKPVPEQSHVLQFQEEPVLLRRGIGMSSKCIRIQNHKSTRGRKLKNLMKVKEVVGEVEKIEKKMEEEKQEKEMERKEEERKKDLKEKERKENDANITQKERKEKSSSGIKKSNENLDGECKQFLINEEVREKERMKEAERKKQEEWEEEVRKELEKAQEEETDETRAERMKRAKMVSALIREKKIQLSKSKMNIDVRKRRVADDLDCALLNKKKIQRLKKNDESSLPTKYDSSVDKIKKLNKVQTCKTYSWIQRYNNEAISETFNKLKGFKISKKESVTKVETLVSPLATVDVLAAAVDGTSTFTVLSSVPRTQNPSIPSDKKMVSLLLPQSDLIKTGEQKYDSFK